MDARAKKLRARPRLNRATENYERQLTRVGGHVGDLIDGFGLKPGEDAQPVVEVLQRYAGALRPVAGRMAVQMLEEVNARDIEQWRVLAKQMSQQTGHDIAHTAVGTTMRKLAEEQVTLITSLPLEAAKRVQRLTVENLISGGRYAEIQAEIERSGEVSRSRAKLIARTEVQRANSNLTQTRALLAGCPRYRWRTMRDGAVRDGHAAMEGKICEWANPPAVDEGGRIMYHHPGCIWNCRCWAEIIVEDV